MKKIIFRFYIVKDDSFFEVYFDSRLSFLDNFKLLKDIYQIDISNMHIYDEYAKKFVCLNIPISKYNFQDYNKLLLF